MDFTCPPDALDRDLVFDFFWKFSVFECALKREGFLREGFNGAAEADWNEFSREVKDQFAQISNAAFKAAVEELAKLSPQRQVVRGGKLAWESAKRGADESDGAHTLRLLKISRNNLFHGGKYPDGDIEELARNKKILGAALTILTGCYALHSGVRRRIDAAA